MTAGPAVVVANPTAGHGKSGRLIGKVDRLFREAGIDHSIRVSESGPELERLARSGVKRLLVLCPAFLSDCLETLEEIGMRGRETFLGAGGQDFQLIPCLNEHPLWIDALEHMVTRFAPQQPSLYLHSP